MTNIEKLEIIGELGSVRQRLGAKDENDERKDALINTLSNHELVNKICGWELGDGSWWDDLKHSFDELENLDKQ
jgi:hypothetical protein